MSTSIDEQRKRIYKGVYLDIKEDYVANSKIARAANKAAIGVDKETVELYVKYGVSDRLPKRLQVGPGDAWGNYVDSSRAQASVGVDLSFERDLESLKNWERRLRNYR